MTTKKTTEVSLTDKIYQLELTVNYLEHKSDRLHKIVLAMLAKYGGHIAVTEEAWTSISSFDDYTETFDINLQEHIFTLQRQPKEYKNG